MRQKMARAESALTRLSRPKESELNIRAATAYKKWQRSSRRYRATSTPACSMGSTRGLDSI